MNKILPWFEPGFDAKIKAAIQAHWPENASLACQTESHRWAKRLIALMPGCEIELNDGMYQKGGDPYQAEGHTWLVVDGYIFDPTADQFGETPDSTYYEIHEYVEGSDLKVRLAAYGYSISAET